MPFYISLFLSRGLSAVHLFLPAVVYVLGSLGLYTLAQQRAIANPWLAWVPVARIFLIGSLSDQYRYVTRGQIRSRRKLLLTLQILFTVCCTVIFFLGIHSVMDAVLTFLGGAGGEALRELAVSSLFRAAGFLLLLLPLFLVLKVFEYMALYDIYRSCDPDDAVMLLVMSILFPFLRAFFLFAYREKEKGMPPRRSIS